MTFGKFLYFAIFASAFLSACTLTVVRDIPWWTFLPYSLPGAWLFVAWVGGAIHRLLGE